MATNEKWEEAFEKLRALLAATELEATIKWGTPVYTLEGKNVLAFAGFKAHFALWFYNGVFLKDPFQVLVTGSEGVTKALRQWRFSSVDELDEDRILQYVREAIENEKAGKRLSPQPKKQLRAPELLQTALKEDPALEAAFSRFSSARQNEFIEYLLAAKQEPTRQRRLEKIKPLVLSGKGLNDQYK